VQCNGESGYTAVHSERKSVPPRTGPPDAPGEPDAPGRLTLDRSGSPGSEAMASPRFDSGVSRSLTTVGAGVSSEVPECPTRPDPTRRTSRCRTRPDPARPCPTLPDPARPDPTAPYPDVRPGSGGRQRPAACLRDKVTSARDVASGHPADIRPPVHPGDIRPPVRPGVSGGPSSTFRPRRRSPAGMMR
jgi:hypothetical protein